MSQGAARKRRKAAVRERLGPKSSVVTPGKTRAPLISSGFGGKVSKTAKKSSIGAYEPR